MKTFNICANGNFSPEFFLKQAIFDRSLLISELLSGKAQSKDAYTKQSHTKHLIQNNPKKNHVMKERNNPIQNNAA